MIMRKFLFSLLAIVLLGACAEDVMVHNVMNTSVTSRSTFSYDSVTSPEVWKTFMSFEEMMNATQIPEDILTELPTDTLVALCMNHPMANNYIYYENHLEGVKFIVDNFNGFKELKKREDASQKILDFYETYDISYDRNNRERNPFAFHRTIIKPLNLGFVELVIASKEFADLYSPAFMGQLESITNHKFEQKLSNKNYMVAPIISKSLLIGSQIKLERTKNVNDSDTKKLKQFVQVGGKVKESSDMTEISRIIYSK